MSQPNFYAIIPASIRYDKRLKANAKLLYGEITALCNQEGFCWADNKYFSDLYEVDHKTISRWISQLEKYGYLKIEHFPMEGNTRKIFIDTSSVSLVIKKSLPSDKKVTPLYENITINNTMNKESTALGFYEVNYPSDFERLMIQFKSQIRDWDHFVNLFEAKVEKEDLNFELKVLSGRFKEFAIHWIKNQGKFESKVFELNPGLSNNKLIGGF